MNATSTIPATAKSTSETITAENGKISRGKYTFVTRFTLPVNEFIENFNELAKKFHAQSPQYAKTGYGTPTSIRAIRVNTTVKMAVLSNGMNTAHPNPIIVCLYRRSRSRFVI